jgi:hypothetical protein
VTRTPEAMETMTRPRIAGRFMMPDLVADTPLIDWNQIANTC